MFVATVQSVRCCKAKCLRFKQQQERNRGLPRTWSFSLPGSLTTTFTLLHALPSLKASLESYLDACSHQEIVATLIGSRFGWLPHCLSYAMETGVEVQPSLRKRFECCETHARG